MGTSVLKIQHSHGSGSDGSCGTGLIPCPELPHTLVTAKKKKKKKKESKWSLTTFIMIIVGPLTYICVLASEVTSFNPYHMVR